MVEGASISVLPVGPSLASDMVVYWIVWIAMFQVEYFTRLRMSETTSRSLR